MHGPAPTRTPDFTGDARAVGHDAAQAVRGLADAAVEIARDRQAPVSTRLGDAAQLAGEAADTARGLAADAGALAQGARRAATEAATAQVARLRAATVQGQRAFEAEVRSHPVRAALVAAAAGALAVELLVRALRRGRSR